MLGESLGSFLRPMKTSYRGTELAAEFIVGDRCLRLQVDGRLVRAAVVPCVVRRRRLWRQASLRAWLLTASLCSVSSRPPYPELLIVRLICLLRVSCMRPLTRALLPLALQHSHGIDWYGADWSRPPPFSLEALQLTSPASSACSHRSALLDDDWTARMQAYWAAGAHSPPHWRALLAAL